MTRRREFITLLGGAAATWPLAARAQQPKVWHVGFLAPVPPTPAMLSAFRDGLRERGYVEGQNLSIDVRWSEGSFEQNPGLAADLVRSNVDVIVAWSSPAVFAARRAAGGWIAATLAKCSTMRGRYRIRPKIGANKI
jgi:putative ABC transport system substrate-binding protein